MTEVIWDILPDLWASAMMLTLSIYHLMIYGGRKKDKEEAYNLYFAMFVLITALFVMAPHLQARHFLAFMKPDWIRVINIEALLSWGLFYNGTKFLNLLMNIPRRFYGYFQIFYLLIAFAFVLTLTSNFISTEFYFRYILVYVLAITVLNFITVYSFYGYWTYQQKLFKQNFFRILYFGFILLTANILIYRSIELLSMPTIMVFNHYISLIILYIFAYALSVKFNLEYFELKELKTHLEQKVIERTEALKSANKLLEEKNSLIEHQKEEIILINEQLSQRAEELLKLDEAKSRFFTGISHEFRTPLTLIIAPLENLLLNSPEETIKTEYLMMLRQAKRLLELINQLLELSKLQKGMMTLKVVKADFNRFVRTIVSAYSSLAEELKIELLFLDKSQELNFYFDKDKIEKILSNLLTNALKFTPPSGKIEFTLNQSVDNQWIEISIQDSGVGIETIHLKNIFDPFYQIHPDIKYSFDSSGIGLSLVKELVELHQGSIEVQSVINKGTQFIIKLPIESPSYLVDETNPSEIEIDYEAQENHFSLELPISKPEAKKTVILLVEDNEDMRYYIRDNLQREYHIVESIHGQDGFEKALEIMPDLIIADVMMPVMNGLEMTEKIKKDEQISHIPVILLTARASSESKIEGLLTQADDYITKPFNMLELRLRIQNLISARKKLKEKFSKLLIINPSEIVTTSIDEKFLQKALEIVERNMTETEFNAEQFCEELCMSRSQVHRKLKALTDQSTTHFIRTIKLKRAAQLLKQNVGSVSEIAYDTGFNNLSYFTRCFKEEFGVLPSEFFLSN